MEFLCVTRYLLNEGNWCPEIPKRSGCIGRIVSCIYQLGMNIRFMTRTSQGKIQIIKDISTIVLLTSNFLLRLTR